MNTQIAETETVDPVKYESAKTNEKKIIELKKLASESFILMGEALYNNRKERLYEALGHESFESFLGDPEISISRSTAFDLMKAYEFFILTHKLDIKTLVEVGVSKVAMLLRLDLDSKAQVEDWVEKARTLSKSDLIDEIKEHQGKTVTHKKSTKIEEAWHVLKLRLAGRDPEKASSWLHNLPDIGKQGCVYCGQEINNYTDVILEGENYRLIVIKCDCGKQSLKLFVN